MRTHKIDRLNVRVSAKEREVIDFLKQQLGLQSDSELIRCILKQYSDKQVLSLVSTDDVAKMIKEAWNEYTRDIDNQHY